MVRRDRGADPTGWETTGILTDRDATRIAHAHARRGDPVTSSLAAASVSNLTRTQERVLDLLAAGPLTRDGLSAQWRIAWPDDGTTDQSIRSRLAELMDQDRVVVYAHERNSRGRLVQRVGLPTESTLFQVDSTGGVA